MARQKRVPQRICVACRQQAGKRDLVRIVRAGDSVQVDATGKLPGRGAYLHSSRACWQRALEQRLLQRALRTPIAAADLEALNDYARSLPEDEDPEDGDEA